MVFSKNRWVASKQDTLEEHLVDTTVTKRIMRAIGVVNQTGSSFKRPVHGGFALLYQLITSG
ncbi:hypothetical protein EYZ11_011200 [Aspergillus tanneri]|uniref:Uncharacterized protein n=1 Tax=Aspergillus tanneri TaxID=1220188 RepID=A0A4S3J8W3_9EURO|nr:hypothetical protein EYZ11_011200 [Aspergillus tanneri]